MENGMSKQFYKVLSEIKKELNHLKEKHSDDYYFEIIVSYELFMMLLDDMKTKSNLQIGNPEICTLFGYPLKVNYENEYEFSYMILARKVGNSLMNKYQEAFERLTSRTYKYADKESVFDDLEVLKSLVDKATPKKPNYEADGYDENGELIYDTWICPNCDKKYEVDYDEYDYCPCCGQAIDWSDE